MPAVFVHVPRLVLIEFVLHCRAWCYLLNMTFFFILPSVFSIRFFQSLRGVGKREIRIVSSCRVRTDIQIAG